MFYNDHILSPPWNINGEYLNVSVWNLLFELQ